MTQMIWQASHHPHSREVTAPGAEVAPLTGEPIALRGDPDLDTLLAMIQRHAAEEMDAVAAYKDLAYRATDPVIRGLMRMLVDDEEHHHRVLNTIAMELRALASSGGREVQVPPRDMGTETVEELRTLATREGMGARELIALAEQTPSLLGGLFALLLKSMAHDSAKHELILRYIADELKAASEESSA
jgi:hypothetical protein